MELLICKKGTDIPTPVAQVEVELENNRKYTNIIWNSKLGVIYGVLDNKPIPLKIIKGNPKVQLDSSPDEYEQPQEYYLEINNEEDGTVTYHYWYY